MPETVVRGWSRTSGAGHEHYFAGPRSLCRLWVYWPPEPDEPDAGRLGKCRDCNGIVLGWAQAKEGGR